MRGPMIIIVCNTSNGPYFEAFKYHSIQIGAFKNEHMAINVSQNNPSQISNTNAITINNCTNIVRTIGRLY